MVRGHLVSLYCDYSTGQQAFHCHLEVNHQMPCKEQVSKLLNKTRYTSRQSLNSLIMCRLSSEHPPIFIIISPCISLREHFQLYVLPWRHNLYWTFYSIWDVICKQLFELVNAHVWISSQELEPQMLVRKFILWVLIMIFVALVQIRSSNSH